jgi:hypothetical protein
MDVRKLYLEAVLFTVLISAEGLLFLVVGAQHHTWIYPRWHDQTQYLSEAYGAYEHMRANGFWAAVLWSLESKTSQGALHDLWGLLVFSVVGPSRIAALSINLFFFLAWQAAFFVAVRRTVESRLLAWASFGLLLALASPWADNQGSMIDFRLDSMAASAFGITLAIGILAGRFESTRWSILFGAAIGLTVLIRFLTGIYFALIFVGMLALAMRGPGRPRRVQNVFLAAAVSCAVAAPLLWINREFIYEYYWVGHYTGAESAVRNVNQSAWVSAISLFKILLAAHLGETWLKIVVVASFILIAAASLPRARPAGGTPDRPVPGRWALHLGLVFFIAPALVLILHPQKSPVVPSILMPAAVLLVVLAWQWLVPRAGLLGRSPTLVIVLPWAASFFAGRMFMNPHSSNFAEGARRVNAIADEIYKKTRLAKVPSAISVDQTTDALDGKALTIVCYERHGEWLPFRQTLPVGVAERAESAIFSALDRSDFVFLTLSGPIGPWPFDAQMRALLPVTRARSEAKLILIDRFTLFGQDMVLYQRPEIAVQ